MHDMFYNPFLLEIVLKIASMSSTLSTILYDMLNSIEDNANVTKRLMKDSLFIGVEIIKSMLGLNKIKHTGK